MWVWMILKEMAKQSSRRDQNVSAWSVVNNEDYPRALERHGLFYYTPFAAVTSFSRQINHWEPIHPLLSFGVSVRSASSKSIHRCLFQKLRTCTTDVESDKKVLEATSRLFGVKASSESNESQTPFSAFPPAFVLTICHFRPLPTITVWTIPECQAQTCGILLNLFLISLLR